MSFSTGAWQRHHAERTVVKAFCKYITIDSLFKTGRLSTNINLTLSNALIRSAMTSGCDTWQYAADTTLSKLKPHKNNVFLKPCTKLTLLCNHRSGHLKTEHAESLLLHRRHLENWSRGPAVSMRSELLAVLEKCGQFLLLTVYVGPVWCEE
jgi:hypothetical protein